MASLPSSTQSDGSGDFVDGRLLDGFLLLAAGGSSQPEDVVSVNLSSLQIADVAAEDLTFFGHLDSLDVSDNQLSDEAVLEHFRRLPRLTRLLLSCNSISSLQVPMNAFRLLEHLDLSHNELHGDVLSQLARLPRLISLNLTSNCISSLPPEEELYDFNCLEELSLDSNDLVQFVQWRALAVLPRLRKLSVASNRVKRLKDDAPEESSDTAYFEALEELDLSQNEIATTDDLPVVEQFRSLQKLILSDNPCTKNGGTENADRSKVHIQDTKPWYLCGSGSFQRRQKSTQPILKMDRKKMRKVRSSKKAANAKIPALQLATLDEQTNQLLVDARGYPSTGVGNARELVGTAPATRGLVASSSLPNQASADEQDLTEEELTRKFAENTAKIQAAFDKPVEPSDSFMRAPPFQVSLLSKNPNSKQEDESSIVGGAQGSVAERVSSSTRPSSTVFLTGVGDESNLSQSRNLRLGSSASATSVVPSPSHTGSYAGSPFGSQPPPSLLAAGLGNSSVMNLPDSSMLPPIHAGTPGSRGSSAGVSRSDPLDFLLNPVGRTKQMPDVGVREAMKALRAAAMSEYAVAV